MLAALARVTGAWAGFTVPTLEGSTSCICSGLVLDDGAVPAGIVGRVLTEARDWRLCRFGVTCVGRDGAVDGWMGGLGGAAAMGTTPGFPVVTPE